MQFGHMIYEINPEGRDQDYEHIQEALYQARLAEELGYDAVWFAQHHFTGESAYGDPIVFATAVAMQTERVKLGFAVLEMATYHPVRVAVQTALLDNSAKDGSWWDRPRDQNKRLRVHRIRNQRPEGNRQHRRGRGPAGQDLDQHRRAALRRRALSRVTLPEGRPQTYQKPHPPLFRGAVSPQSVAEMGRRGRLVLFRSESAVEAREHVELYRKSMLEAGFDEAAVQQNLDQCWMWRDCYVAESDAQAQEEFTGGLERWLEGMGELRAQWNPQTPNMKTETGEGPLPVSAYGEHPDPRCA